MKHLCTPFSCWIISTFVSNSSVWARVAESAPLFAAQIVLQHGASGGKAENELDPEAITNKSVVNGFAFLRKLREMHNESGSAFTRTYSRA